MFRILCPYKVLTHAKLLVNILVAVWKQFAISIFQDDFNPTNLAYNSITSVHPHQTTIRSDGFYFSGIEVSHGMQLAEVLEFRHAYISLPAI